MLKYSFADFISDEVTLIFYDSCLNGNGGRPAGINHGAQVGSRLA